MGLSVKVLAFAAPLLSSFLSTIVTASPLDIGEMPPEVRPVPKTSPSIWIPPTTSVPLIAPPINPADVICFHAADPNNICPAIADSPGYCECNNDGKTYEVLGPTNPCEWTTLPATTSFDCSPPAARVKRAPTTSPAPPPQPPAPPGPPPPPPPVTLECTLT